MSKYSALTPDGRRVLLEVGEYFDRDGVLRQCQPDPQALRIDQLKEEVAELKALCAKQQAKIHEADVDMLVSLAIDEGKVLPAQRQWAMSLGRIHFAKLQAFVAVAPSLVAAGRAKS